MSLMFTFPEADVGQIWDSPGYARYLVLEITPEGVIMQCIARYVYGNWEKLQMKEKYTFGTIQMQNMVLIR